MCKVEIFILAKYLQNYTKLNFEQPASKSQLGSKSEFDRPSHPYAPSGGLKHMNRFYRSQAFKW